MKAQQRLDRVLESINLKVQEEVGGLMGVNFEVLPSQNQLLNKEDCFDLLAGKQVVAKMDITGEIEGKGCLSIGLKDAIRLGGTLIMLPPAELDEVIRSADYSEETEDSYGEIANIIAGSYTKVFEEMYPDNCRFVRKEQELIQPLKVDIQSDEPVPNQVYYCVASAMNLDGVEMGNLVMLIPADTFGLDTEELMSSEKSALSSPEELEVKEEVDELPVSTPEVEEELPDTSTTPPEDIVSESQEEETSPPQESSIDTAKQQKRVDSILQTCQENISEEVGALLGVGVSLTEIENKVVSKEDYLFDEAIGKQVLAHMEIKDGIEDTCYLFIGLKDAIRIGGVLIMLPPSEIEVVVNEEDFSADAEDAYGEIANIISGVYTAVFQEQFNNSMRFVKTELQEVAPMKLDVEAEDPFPNQNYYLTSSVLNIEGKSYGKVQMLFPLQVLSLEGLDAKASSESDISLEGVDAKASSETDSPKEEASKTITSSSSGQVSDVPGTVAPSDDLKIPDILLIGDDEGEIAKIVNFLNSWGMASKNLSPKDNPHNYISDNLKAVMVVMKEVDEQSFGLLIKVSSASSVPLIMGGPAWTRTKVINAVKYGVCDILLTPSSDADIREKIEANIVKMAA